MKHDHSRVTFRPTLVLAALMLTGLLSQVSAQLPLFHESWRWSHFTTESGLPSNQVFCIAETPAGTIWVGTDKGLAWFDEFGWNTIDSGQGIPSTEISLIEPYGNDSILVFAGKDLYLGSRRHFSLLVSQESMPGMLSCVSTANGDILLLSSMKLCAYTKGTLKQIPVPARPISSRPRNMVRTASGNIWLNTVRGVYRRDGKVWQLVFPVKKSSITGFFVSEDANGNGLAAMTWPPELEGIHEWQRNRRPHRSPTEEMGSQQTMDQSPNDDALVIYQSGDVRFRTKGLWSSVVPSPDAFTSTHVVKYRKDGDLWVGTEKGLYLFHATSRRWTYMRHPFPDSRNGVQEITSTSDGSLWLGTSNGIEIHRPNGRTEYITNILGTELGPVTGIVEDYRHDIWVCSGATFSGAFRWDRSRWRHFGPEDGLKAERVHKIRLDRSGRLWFLGIGETYSDSIHQPGAFVYENGSFTHWDKRTSEKEGLISGRVYGFAEGRDGARWFATQHGLSRWKEGAWHHWTQSQGLQLRNDRIFALAIDSNGTVWFSNSEGLGTVDKDDQLHFMTTVDGLVHNSVWDLKVDGDGTLWISTQRGLSAYKNGVWSNFGLRSGLNTSDLMDLLPLRDRIYVGSKGAGVMILDRTEVDQPPRVRFSTPSVEGTTALLRWTALPYFGNMDARDVEVRYRRDSSSWSRWSPRREVSLTDLASGYHRFEVQAKGLFGKFAQAGEKMDFYVEPGLFQRPMFLLALALLAGSFSILGGAYFQRKRKYQQALQESDERFHLVANTTADVIYDWNLKNDRLWMNDPQRSWISGPRAEFSTAREEWLSYVHPDDRAQLEKAMNDAAERHISDWQAEYRFLNTDGNYGHMLHRGHFEFDESGIPVRALGSIMDITERKQAEGLSRSISKRIIEAQESERRRVSRDLHDSVNQILASVKFRIESLEEQLPGRNKSIRREARKTRLLLNKVMKEIRRISRNLRPAELDDLGLGSAVRSLADEFSERTKITTIVKDGWPKKTLSPEVRLTLYRIIQESLTNVEKHAKAKRVRIGCTATENEITCTIEDNGQGIRTDEHGKTRIKGGGLGLLDMQERLSFIGGTLQISSVPRRGTVVTIYIPLGQSLPQEQMSA
ncbi:MAG: two-component regulator propeller domain-containing protein [Bacteroidota bacterium]|jgi:PAS domain S-box-containing protein